MIYRYETRGTPFWAQNLPETLLISRRCAFAGDHVVPKLCRYDLVCGSPRPNGGDWFITGQTARPRRVLKARVDPRSARDQVTRI
jgi:hypothetical protein